MPPALARLGHIEGVQSPIGNAAWSRHFLRARAAGYVATGFLDRLVRATAEACGLPGFTTFAVMAWDTHRHHIVIGFVSEIQIAAVMDFRRRGGVTLLAQTVGSREDALP